MQSMPWAAVLIMEDYQVISVSLIAGTRPNQFKNLSSLFTFRWRMMDDDGIDRVLTEN